MMRMAWLAERAVLAVGGADRVPFLNGLVSNDVALAQPGRAVWAALLTPQGKYFTDFFMFDSGDRLLLECEAQVAEELERRLLRYRLRAAVSIRAETLRVYAAWGGTAPEGGYIVAPDPRLPEAGWRVLSAVALPETASASEYDLHRITLGLPDGARDLERDKTVLLEAGFDELNGVSWTKGCYMGQELTARTRYRGLIKRRLLPVEAADALPPPGTPVLHGEKEVGELRSSVGTLGLATLRLEALRLEPLLAGGIPVTIRRTDWMRLPDPG